MAPSDSLEELVRELPPELEREVEDFVRFVLHRREQAEPRREANREPRIEWAGALGHLEGITAVDLQHETLDEWGG